MVDKPFTPREIIAAMLLEHDAGGITMATLRDARTFIATPANGEQVERVAALIVEDMQRQAGVSNSTVSYDEECGVMDYDGCFRPVEIARRIAATLSTPTEDARSRVKVLEEALREAHDTLYECTAVLTANDCATVAAVMSRARTALGNKETDRHG